MSSEAEIRSHAAQRTVQEHWSTPLTRSQAIAARQPSALRPRAMPTSGIFGESWYAARAYEPYLRAYGYAPYLSIHEANFVAAKLVHDPFAAYSGASLG